jgi:hypothetical protein
MGRLCRAAAVSRVRRNAAASGPGRAHSEPASARARTPGREVRAAQARRAKDGEPPRKPTPPMRRRWGVKGGFTCPETDPRGRARGRNAGARAMAGHSLAHTALWWNRAWRIGFPLVLVQDVPAFTAAVLAVIRKFRHRYGDG